jgi:hypothetical protein
MIEFIPGHPNPAPHDPHQHVGLAAIQQSSSSSPGSIRSRTPTASPAPHGAHRENFLGATHQALQVNVIRNYRGLLAAIRQQPARHGIDGSFATTTAFVLGCDAGTSCSMLAGHID